jgi:hypothetical protein
LPQADRKPTDHCSENYENGNRARRLLREDRVPILQQEGTRTVTCAVALRPVQGEVPVRGSAGGCPRSVDHVPGGADTAASRVRDRTDYPQQANSGTQQGAPSATWSDEKVDFRYADVPRPKTEHIAEDDAGEGAPPRERLALPGDVADVLRGWWHATGCRVDGPVFPEQRHSYARELRSALRRAGVVRVELHKPTDKTLPVDFHSFRRAFVTAIGKAGLNAQTAMRLTGHTTMATHMRYNRPDILSIPEVAVPSFRSRPAGDDRSDGQETSE